MKTKICLLLFLSLQISLFSQCVIPDAISSQDGNEIDAKILNGGDLFWDGSDGSFIAPANDPIPKSSVFAAGLWMGGIDPGGGLKLAGQTYGRPSGLFDFSPGPLNDNGTVNEEYCVNFNKIWKVTIQDIQAHQLDYADNGIIDNPIDAIFSWPGRGSNEFLIYNGFVLPSYVTDYAPFEDLNGDNTYDPHLGEYPHPPNTIPELSPITMNWTIFNDNTIHLQTNGDPINAEIHLTSWSFDCPLDKQLDNTIFTSHRIINKSLEPLDSFHVGIWVDFDLGCYLDDYIGSHPAQNAFFAYNSDNLDGEASATDCQGVNTYGENIPAQSIQFLNQSLDYLTYYNNSGVGIPPPPGTYDPSTPIQMFNYLTGSWADGTQMTQGGDGYNPSSTEFVNHAFPDNPNDPQGWSMYQEGLADGDRRIVASHSFGQLEPQEVVTLDMAYSFHKYNAIPDHLEIVDQMYPDIDMVQQMYDMEFNGWCGAVTDVEDLFEEKIDLYPNPSTGLFNLNIHQQKVEKLSLVDVRGRQLWQKVETQLGNVTLDFSHFAKGVYFLQIETDQERFAKKLIIQ